MAGVGPGGGGQNTVVSKAYEKAKAGGTHAGLLLNIRRTQGVDQLRAAIKTYSKRIREHEAWIADPLSKPGVSNYPAEDVERWVNEKWPADIERLKAQRDLYQGVLKEKEDGSQPGRS